MVFVGFTVIEPVVDPRSQLVALVDVQVRVEDCPDRIDVGLAVKVTLTSLAVRFSSESVVIVVLLLVCPPEVVHLSV